MSRRRLIGYNIDHSSNSITPITSEGTILMSRSGDILMIPAGWGVQEIKIKKSTIHDLIGSAIQVSIYLYSPFTRQQQFLYTVDKIDLNHVPELVKKMINGRKFIEDKLSEYDQFVMVKTDQGTCGINNSGISVSLKIKNIR